MACVTEPTSNKERRIWVNNQSSNQLEPWRHFLELEFSRTETLRNHTETMANAGVTVQIGLTAGILTWDTCWPPEWVPSILSLAPLTVVILAFIVIWLFIHFFVRWQLRSRRLENLRYNALDSTLRKWAGMPPNCIKLVTLDPKKDWLCCLLVFLDLFLPIPMMVMRHCSKLPNYPSELVTAWKDHGKEWVVPIRHHEWMYLLGSFIMFSLGLARIVLSSTTGN